MPDDQPAFPIPPRIDCLKKYESDESPDEWEVHYETDGEGAEWPGMSLRDYFAAAALTGILANVDFTEFEDDHEGGETTAELRARAANYAFSTGPTP